MLSPRNARGPRLAVAVAVEALLEGAVVDAEQLHRRQAEDAGGLLSATVAPRRPG